MRSSDHAQVHAGCERCSIRFCLYTTAPADFLTKKLYCPACGRQDGCFLQNGPVPPGDLERDGPIAPDKFRLRGTVYTISAKLEWMLLSILWDRDAVPVQEAIEHLYGHDADDKESALKNVKNRLNRHLADQGIPGQVRFKTEMLLLEIDTQPASIEKGSPTGTQANPMSCSN